MEVVVANKLAIVSFLFALSELLALVPAIKANSIFQLVANMLKKVAGK
jgi:hypothetical protein